MYYAVTSMAFGGAMYFLGRFGVLDQFIASKLQSNTQTSQKINKQQQTHLINNTFTDESIIGITRNIQINPRCKIIYSTLHKTPLSVHQLLDLQTIQGDAQRARYFHKDKNIFPQKFAINDQYYTKSKAYRNLSLNRGHMAAASNYSSNQQYKYSTFSFANVIPQNGYNNGGIWNTFQRYCRNLLINKKCQTIQIISGPIFTTDKQYQDMQNVYIKQQLVLMKNGITIPSKLYKIIKCNTKDRTYASGFTFYNSKTYDNDKLLLQFEQQLQNIQDSTGLYFNFKDKLNGKLSQYDNQGLNRTKKLYDKQFYHKLFNYAKTVDQMNQALRRSYQQKINMDQIRQKNIQNIQNLANKEINDIKTSNTYNQCKKLTQYLNLHKSLFYLGGDKDRFTSLIKNIQQQIYNNIESCRKIASPQDQSNIAWKAGYKDRRYSTPFANKLMQMFPRIRKQTTVPELEKRSSTESTISQVSQVKNASQ